MSQCFNIVYLAGGFTHALNDALHGAERKRLGVPVFMLAKDHWYPAPRKLRQGFLGGGVKLYAICFQRMINNCACLVVFDSDSWFGPHMAAVDPSCADTPVRALRTFIQDLRDLADWFKACGVTSVEMESTGVYSIPAYEILEQHGFEVILVTARYAKNVPGRKTDAAMPHGCASFIPTVCSAGASVLMPRSQPCAPICVSGSGQWNTQPPISSTCRRPRRR
jgi:hypothetical protein